MQMAWNQKELKNATKFIFSLYSESVSKHQRKMQLLKSRGESIGGNEERKTGTIAGCKQQASVICDSAYECHCQWAASVCTHVFVSFTKLPECAMV